MASKRTENRAYWLAVKETSRYLQHPKRSRDYAARAAYQDALNGTPDSTLLPVLNELEYIFGPHFTHIDLANSGLWEARDVIDAMRKSHA